MKKPVSFVFVIVLFKTLSPATACQSRRSQRTAPVLEVKPQASDGSNLIRYRPQVDADHWTKKLDDLMKPYIPGKNWEKNIRACSPDYPPPEGTFCDFNIGYFLPCDPEKSYGFNSSVSGPCIFLKLSKVREWTPQFYNSTNLPKEMPNHLKEEIIRSEGAGWGQQIWVTCEGEEAADVENLGPVLYFPNSGFPGYYFPYTGVHGYLSPLVAVFFEKPKRGVLISVICTAWAVNIPRDKENNLGVVHLQLLKD